MVSGASDASDTRFTTSVGISKKVEYRTLLNDLSERSEKSNSFNKSNKSLVPATASAKRTRSSVKDSVEAVDGVGLRSAENVSSR